MLLATTNFHSAEQPLNIAAVTASGATLLGYLQGIAGVVAAVLSAIWLTFQIVAAVQNQIDRRRLLRLRAVADVHAMNRADKVTQAIQEQPIVPVVVVPETAVDKKPA